MSVKNTEPPATATRLRLVAMNYALFAGIAKLSGDDFDQALRDSKALIALAETMERVK